MCILIKCCFKWLAQICDKCLFHSHAHMWTAGETSVLFPTKAIVQQLSYKVCVFLLQIVVAIALQTLRDSIRYMNFLGMLNKVKFIDKLLRGLEPKHVYINEKIFSPESISIVFQGYSYIHCTSIFENEWWLLVNWNEEPWNVLVEESCAF